VITARRPKTESTFHSTKYDWDLIVTIQDLIFRWCKEIAFSFHWVKGTADRIDRSPTRDEILNIEADIQADAISVQTCGPIAACPNFPHWDIDEASLLVRGSKVTSDMNNQLTSQMHDGSMLSF
jgi:hypothetical protein